MNRNNLRGTWQMINEIIGKKVTNIDETIKRNFPNKNIKDVAEEFAQKFKENVKNIIHICDVKTSTNMQTSIQNTIYISFTNEEEIYNILKNLNARKSAGADRIRAMDLKNNAKALTPIITRLTNSSIEESKIPDLLKTSIVRPIQKSGSRSDYNNYRPISILPVLEKVLEEIVARRLNDFLDKYKLISENQYGFQKGRNINQLLGRFSNHINQNLSKNMHCIALFIDFSKAFDTLSHKKLIDTLERTGIRGQCIEWFKNYLQYRTYRVKIENNLSATTHSIHGVPQGSKLGPILYIIYANEMLNILKESTVFAYADDTAILVSNNCLNMATQTMQREFNIITRWCHDSGLIINATKTKLMYFRPRHIPPININITFHNTECLHKLYNNNTNTIDDDCATQIELVNTYKYLGVHLDSHFKWKTHIDSLQKKLRKASYALYHLSNCSPYNVLKQAYFSLVESVLRHGVTAWGSATYCKKLQHTQNRLIKILYKNQHYTKYSNQNILNDTAQNNIKNINHQQPNQNINLYTELKILNINGIYKTTITNEFYNNQHYLKQIEHDQNTRMRAQGRYQVPSYKNDYGKYSLAVTLPTTFNQLPTTLHNLTNKASRTKLVKNHFMN